MQATESERIPVFHNPRDLMLEEAKRKFMGNAGPSDSDTPQDAGVDPLRSWELDPLSFKVFCTSYGTSSPSDRLDKLNAKLADKSLHIERKKRLASYVIWYEATKGGSRECARMAYLNLFPNVKTDK